MKTTKEKIAVMQAYEDGREIQYCPTEGGWHNYRGSSDPIWDWDTYDYRIKQSTILVNGIEVPEPVREMPERDTQVYAPDVIDCCVYRFAFWPDAEVHMERFNSGVMHLTESAARQHYEALIAPSRVKK